MGITLPETMFAAVVLLILSSSGRSRRRAIPPRLTFAAARMAAMAAAKSARDRTLLGSGTMGGIPSDYGQESIFVAGAGLRADDRALGGAAAGGPRPPRPGQSSL